MKILLLQTDIKWLDGAANKKRAQELIDNSPSADLIILPEMFTTGYITSPQGVAEDAEGETLLWMQKTAQKTDAAIIGSIPVTQNGKYYNRLYFVKPDGQYSIYDKRHLFSYSGEDREYTAGSERVIIEFRGVRILPLICYDLRFPIFSRNTGDYDLAIYVANWSTLRIHAWQTLLKARAIENLSYVAGVNRVGSDPNSDYTGNSAIIDFLGNPLAESEKSIESTIMAEIDIEKLRQFREEFPALSDADNFTIKM